MPTVLISQAVGKNAPNRSSDVMAVHNCLMSIGKIPCYSCRGQMDEQIMKGIEEVQRHFMLRPDLLLNPGGTTIRYLNAWVEKPISPGVQLPGRLREAWDWVNPLLPQGSYCSSGFRSAEQQRRILHKFYNETYRSQIIGKYTQETYDEMAKNLLANEQEVLKMVRGVGQAIATPGKSMHQRARAIDIGGPAIIDAKQVAVVKVVVRAHPDLLSGVVLRERNGCVHFEIR